MDDKHFKILEFFHFHNIPVPSDLVFAELERVYHEDRLPFYSVPRITEDLRQRVYTRDGHMCLDCKITP